MTLKDAAPFEWYEIMNSNGLVPYNSCIQYIEHNPVTNRHFFIGEGIFEEIGYYIHDEEIGKIEVKHLIF